ncbi:hypothetical protein BJ138DRAFT_1168728 [Hygrophoropsis aurantiaca]|uniref:Uncharacterized protein n=1 Tax=Hygrophoropsis aurantiaca TaxID=72124 RepID=A0ACB7ZP21_9AGAM|nr:hypothetical protein BJ138DRAFT_1168728 [Hygrophoropsis aurantiaca]
MIGSLLAIAIVIHYLHIHPTCPRLGFIMDRPRGYFTLNSSLSLMRRRTHLLHLQVSIAFSWQRVCCSGLRLSPWIHPTLESCTQYENLKHILPDLGLVCQESMDWIQEHGIDSSKGVLRADG